VRTISEVPKVEKTIPAYIVKQCTGNKIAIVTVGCLSLQFRTVTCLEYGTWAIVQTTFWIIWVSAAK